MTRRRFAADTRNLFILNLPGYNMGIKLTTPYATTSHKSTRVLRFAFGIKSQFSKYSSRVLVHNMTDALSHNPTRPSASEKDKNPVVPCLGRCGVKGNTVKASPQTEKQPDQVWVRRPRCFGHGWDARPWSGSCCAP